MNYCFNIQQKFRGSAGAFKKAPATDRRLLRLLTWTSAFISPDLLTPNMLNKLDTFLNVFNLFPFLKLFSALTFHGLLTPPLIR